MCPNKNLKVPESPTKIVDQYDIMRIPLSKRITAINRRIPFAFVWLVSELGNVNTRPVRFRSAIVSPVGRARAAYFNRLRVRSLRRGRAEIRHESIAGAHAQQRNTVTELSRRTKRRISVGMQNPKRRVAIVLLARLKHGVFEYR